MNDFYKKKSLSSSNVNISHSDLKINNSYFKSRKINFSGLKEKKINEIQILKTPLKKKLNPFDIIYSRNKSQNTNKLFFTNLKQRNIFEIKREKLQLKKNLFTNENKIKLPKIKKNNSFEYLKSNNSNTSIKSNKIKIIKNNYKKLLYSKTLILDENNKKIFEELKEEKKKIQKIRNLINTKFHLSKVEKKKSNSASDILNALSNKINLQFPINKIVLIQFIKNEYEKNNSMNDVNNFKQEYNKSIEKKNMIQKTTDLVSRIIERNKKLNK